jgi:hypothetical protein
MRAMQVRPRAQKKTFWHNYNISGGKEMSIVAGWLHGISVEQIDSLTLQLSDALAMIYTLSQAWEEPPCPLGQQLTDR